MSDLLQRLRAHYPYGGLPREAADRIEALEAALRPFVRHYEPWMDEYEYHQEVSVFPRHTFGELRAARAALAPEQDK